MTARARAAPAARPLSVATRLTIAYDGGPFAGWARQPGRRTVQGELERALAVVLRRDRVALTVAGRTDSGVHALAQVASYDGPPPPRIEGVNALLGGEIAVVFAEAVAAGFDARRDARSRRYRYRVLTGRIPSPFEVGRALHWRHRLDVDALHACAAALVGEHDFTAFTPTETDHVRFRRVVLDTAWRREDDDILTFSIEADSFMRHMNRVLVGTMLEVGAGRRSLEGFVALLEGAPRAAAGPTAPPHGLYFVEARY